MYYTTTILPKGLRPLDSRNARRCASRIPKAKGMKGKKNKHKPKADALISFRLTSEQRGAFQRQVEVTGLSTSEYIRRKIFGGRPLIARTDAMMIQELRRIGGLLKHNFETLRQAGANKMILEQQEQTLRLLIFVIEQMGMHSHDR